MVDALDKLTNSGRLEYERLWAVTEMNYAAEKQELPLPLAIAIDVYHPKTHHRYGDCIAAGNRHWKPGYTKPLTEGELRKMSSAHLHQAKTLHGTDGSTLRDLAAVAKQKYYPGSGVPYGHFQDRGEPLRPVPRRPLWGPRQQLRWARPFQPACIAQQWVQHSTGGRRCYRPRVRPPLLC